jgi:hypothetical protein
MFQRVTVVQNGLVLPRTATTIPQAGVKSLYTISGGTVVVLQIRGVVTTVIAGGANATKFQFKPSGQTAIDLCATAELNGLAVNQQIGVAGPPASALLTGYGIAGASQGVILGPGTIDLNCVAAAGTGALRFIVRYLTEDPSAQIVLA